MKKIVVILNVLLFAQTALAATVITTMGDRSCGLWVQHRTNRGPATLGAEAWLIGYMTGLAAATNKDILRAPDGASLYLWMDNYCRANPLSSTYAGGLKLFEELDTKR